ADATNMTLRKKNGDTFPNVTTGTVKWGEYVRNGTLAKSYTLELVYTDNSAGGVQSFQYYPGMRVGSMSLDITAQQRITGAVGFDGKQGFFNSGGKLPADGANLEAGTTDPMTASANVAQLVFDMDSLGAGPNVTPLIQQVTMDLNGNNRIQPAVGDKFPIGIGQGTISMTGAMNMYFQDDEFFNLMTAHTYFGFTIPMLDAQGGAVIITFPKIVLTDGAPTVPGRNQDVFENKGFQAVRHPAPLVNDTDATFGIQIDEIPA
ncbi:unnamed protein product, partial [marine sediment metagenome]